MAVVALDGKPLGAVQVLGGIQLVAVPGLDDNMQAVAVRVAEMDSF